MIHDRSTFEKSYAGQPPWEIGKPQNPFIDVTEGITGTVLDAGCGIGDTALLFAGRGCNVTGIDFIEEVINRARRKAG